MNLIDHALDLAAKGFYVFPCMPNSKIPALKDFPNVATRDEAQIRLWWRKYPNNNIGIFTGKYNGAGEALLALDVDNKGVKKGDEELLRLELGGLYLPKTFEQVTPTGGRHLVFKVKDAVTGGANVLGPGLDIRSYGQYIIGAGSKIGGKNYYYFDVEVKDAPEDFLAHFRKAKEKSPKETVEINVDQSRAIERAKKYLLEEAPRAIEGMGGDATTFQVACALKDLGLSTLSAFEVMADVWNPKCEPPWEMTDLQTKIENAYAYGSDAPGSKNPELIFGGEIELPADAPVEIFKAPPETKLSPVLELNKDHAFIMINGKSQILFETTDFDGNFHLEYSSIQAFHDKMRPYNIMFNDKKHQVSNLWLASKERRQYSGVCFRPEQKTPSNLYNLWRGFSVEEKMVGTERAEKSVKAFLDHAFENVCGSNLEIFNWLMGYFAHMVQRPWEKPLVALVFKGKKGVGKNALIERIGHLFSNHFILASNPRYLIGNFNSHLERCLLFVLDEATWAGDKKTEGILKDVITGAKHLIERKGSEPYAAKNLTRVVVIGNDDWLIPASHDERRFAVFDVGDGNKQNGEFFQEMREGMEAGGYGLLLHYLKNFPISNVNKAPNTQALADQKVSSLTPFYNFWFESLKEGRFESIGFETEWPEWVSSKSLMDAYYRSARERGASAWKETPEMVGKLIRRCLPSMKHSRRRNGGPQVWGYSIPDLAQSRKEWEDFIGHKFDWGEE